MPGESKVTENPHRGAPLTHAGRLAALARRRRPHRSPVRRVVVLDVVVNEARLPEPYVHESVHVSVSVGVRMRTCERQCWCEDVYM